MTHQLFNELVNGVEVSEISFLLSKPLLNFMLLKPIPNEEIQHVWKEIERERKRN